MRYITWRINHKYSPVSRLGTICFFRRRLGLPISQSCNEYGHGLLRFSFSPWNVRHLTRVWLFASTYSYTNPPSLRSVRMFPFPWLRSGHFVGSMIEVDVNPRVKLVNSAGDVDLGWIQFARYLVLSTSQYGKIFTSFNSREWSSRRNCKVQNADYIMEGIIMALYRVAQKKNGTAYFPQYVDTITGIKLWGNYSWKNDTKIGHFGSVVSFLGHILWDNVETPNFPFSA